jgi:hypothetical protein
MSEASRSNDDPLVRLAEQLERLSEAHLKLSEHTASLIPLANADERRFLREAASVSRQAARTAASASAEVASVHAPLVD